MPLRGTRGEGEVAAEFIFDDGDWGVVAWGGGDVLAWGAYHGVVLCLERVVGGGKKAGGGGGAGGGGMDLAGVGMVVTFHVVCGGWLLFRANSMGQVWEFLGRMEGDGRVWRIIAGAVAAGDWRGGCGAG